MGTKFDELIQELAASEKQIKEGKIFTHEEVMAEFGLSKMSVDANILQA